MSAEERQGLLSQVRHPSGAHGPARRAHAILLLDDWLSSADEAALVEAPTERLFTTTAEVIALVEERFAVRCSRSGMIKLLTRLGFEYRKPKALPRLPSVEAQKAFVEAYERLLNGLDAKDQVVFGDAVHPEYQTRPAHGWIMKGDPVTVTRTTGRQRLNLIFLPPYAPNLNAIERLWAVLHRTVTHNKFYPSFNDFANSIRIFFRDTLPTEWDRIRDRVSDTFHIINRDDFRVLT